MTLNDKLVAGWMETLRSMVRDIVLRGDRIPLTVLARKHRRQCGGAYILIHKKFGAVRVGSSLDSLPARIRGQRREVVKGVAPWLAKELAVPMHEKCTKCGHILHTQTHDYKGVRASQGDFSVIVIPDSVLRKHRMSVRQFEGFLLWAPRPPMNHPDAELKRSPLCGIGDR